MKQLSILIYLTLIASILRGQKSDVKINRPLLREIRKMEKVDQKWRDKYVKITTGKHSNDSTAINSVNARINRVDSLNYIKASAIFHTYGYPDRDIAGQTGDFYFWLVVQHMDDHPLFQDSVLSAMKVAVDSGKSNGTLYAYLLDRVSVNSGKLQIYGTQMQLNADSTSYEPQPCVDPEHLDERRKAVGLEPIADYIESMNKEYLKPKSK